MRSLGYMEEPDSVLPTPALVTIQTSLMTSRKLSPTAILPQGRGCGVGRGLAVGVGLPGVAVGVTLGVTVGVTLGVPVGVGVGVGVPPGQVPSTLYTMCMFGKPISPVGVGSFSPQSTALR